MPVRYGDWEAGRPGIIENLISRGPDIHMMANGKMIGLRLWAALQHQRSGSLCSFVAIMAKALCLGLLAGSVATFQTAAANDATQSPSMRFADGAATPSPIDEKQPLAARYPKRANLQRETASQEVRYIADWVVDSGDNLGMPFVIVDKTNAKVFVFHADGQLRSSSSALLGLALGDDAVPGIGNRKLSTIRPEERTTPAGRFVAALGRNVRGVEILWVDYDGAVSLHQVITTNPKERRLERLATPTPLDKRISYGCINVPVKFFKNVVRPAFAKTDGIVYVLPETRSAREVFKSYDVDEHAGLPTVGQAVPLQITSGATRN
jgi:hypothetical protein